jgi:hypothetical protein
MVSVIPVAAWVLALAAAAFVLARAPRPLTLARGAEELARWLIVFPIGLQGLWAAFGHVFFPEMAAKAIGWQTSPFQFEVGVANLGIGVAAIYAALRGYEARLAVALVAACFLVGAGIGHIREILQTGNLAPGNAGPILFTDILTPLALLFLLWLSRPRATGAR